MPPKKKPASPETPAVPPAPVPKAEEIPQPAPQPKTGRAPMIKSRGVAALISFFLPGVGLVLGNPSRTLEGAFVFVVVAILDALVALISVTGGPLAGLLTQGACCLLTPVFLLGLFLIPLLHILAAIHTWLRC